MWRILLCAALVAVVAAVDMQTILSNTQGYKLDKDVTYLISIPRKVRPNQVLQVFASIIHLEFGNVNVRVSVVKENIEYAGTSLQFNRPSSRLLQLQMPKNALAGQYKVKVEGQLVDNPSGYVFYREADLLFDSKQASVFIQMSKPVYCQGQKVHFRVIPVYPDLMPRYDSLTIYVMDPTGFAVRRWMGQQTNAGGIVSQSFELADQPKFGNWSILVTAFGAEYTKEFTVEEFWTPRFDVNVTVSPYIMDDREFVNGVVLSNHTSGKATIGSAVITLTVVPPNAKYFYDKSNPHLPILTKDVEYFNGRINFEFSMREILQNMRQRMFPAVLKNSELIFNVTVKDWYLAMTRNGSATTFCYSSNVIVDWVGSSVRSFKPGSTISATVAVMKQDGRMAPYENKYVKVSIARKDSTGGFSSNNRVLVEKRPVNGFASFNFTMGDDTETVILKAEYGDSPVAQLVANKYYSPSKSFVSVSTSTKYPKVNEYMVFHVKTSVYVPKIFYQVIAKGNIIVGDELEMGASRQKTFSVALARSMVPTAHIVVYYIRTADQEVVIDVLSFFINGTSTNEVKIFFNRGKDFTQDTVEVNAYADPGSYVALTAVPYDLYIRGMSSGLSQNILIDELYTYNAPANTSYRHLWRISEAEYEYKFFSANGYGMDAESTFFSAGLLVLTDANITRLLPPLCSDPGMKNPCFKSGCYSDQQRCNGVFDCVDGADEYGCPKRHEIKLITNIHRVSRVQRFYDDSSWLWQEYFVKADGRIDFSVKTPKYPLTWVVHGISLSRELGLGITPFPVMYDAARFMYIQVEAPTFIVRGEQVGFRVTVFSYWYIDDFIEVLVTAHASPYHKFVLVGDLGIVQSYNPELADGDMQTLLFLEPGESQDIYMPVIPTIQTGCFDVKISATCFMERDYHIHHLCVKSDGVTNYYHIPYMIDLITQASVIVPDFDIPIKQQFIQPEQREHDYVPGSGKAVTSLFGDVVTPGFFDEYLNAENILYKPYGAGENMVFNFAYNLMTLKFKKASKQLSDETLQISLRYLNIALQRIMSYMNKDGSFSMFRDHSRPSIWLTSFVAKTLYSARAYGEWERDFFVPLEMINEMVVWICNQQDGNTGAFHSNGSAYDRKMTSLNNWQDPNMPTDPVILTSYVLVTLYSITDVSNDASRLIKVARQRAASYLSLQSGKIQDDDVFKMAITAYALSLSSEKSVQIFDRLWKLVKGAEQKYFSYDVIPPNPSEILDNIRYLKPRVEQRNDAYGVQSTAYALMAHIKHNRFKYERDSLMKWLNSMRNSIGGMASTQDTIVAMEALYEYTQVDPNRNIFNMLVKVWSTANDDYRIDMQLTKSNYTNLSTFSVHPNVWGYIRAQVFGTGRAMLQLTTTVNVEYPHQLKVSGAPKSFNLDVDSLRFSGRNDSIMEMRLCTSWINTDLSRVSGMAVLEVDIPTGYVTMNSTLRDYVQSGIVPNLKRAESYGRKIVFYFDRLDESKTCVFFQANRWYPVANSTIHHRIRVYDYYEPGLFVTQLYNTHNLFQLNICFVCGSFQCPYCPQFNVATVIKSTITLLCIVLGTLLQRYILRNS